MSTLACKVHKLQHLYILNSKKLYQILDEWFTCLFECVHAALYTYACACMCAYVCHVDWQELVYDVFTYVCVHECTYVCMNICLTQRVFTFLSAIKILLHWKFISFSFDKPFDTHTYTHVYIHIHIYRCVCACICVHSVYIHKQLNCRMRGGCWLGLEMKTIITINICTHVHTYVCTHLPT